MIKFRQKDFSILSSTIKGAGIGGAIAGGATIFRPKHGSNSWIGKKLDWERNKEDYVLGKDKSGKTVYDFDQKKADENFNRMKILGVGMLVGAALGALVGTVLEVSKKVNRAKTVDARLMEKVLRGLKSSNLVEGRDFTRDPKQATQMKTRVCIVISKYSGELKLMINVARDKKLEQVASQIVKNIPNTSNVITREGDKYNDIIISTISDGSADAGLVCGIIEGFVHSKYPVYIVEVG